MKVLLVDRCGFERETDGLAGHTIIVPRRFAPGQSHFRWHGEVQRDGETLAEYREEDDMPAELHRAYETADYLRDKIRRLESRVRSLESENGALALEIRRRA